MCHEGSAPQCTSFRARVLDPEPARCGPFGVENISLWVWACLGVCRRLPTFAAHALSLPRGACPGCNSIHELLLMMMTVWLLDFHSCLVQALAAAVVVQACYSHVTSSSKTGLLAAAGM